MAIETTEKLYTTKEAGIRLGLGGDTVRQYIHRKLITAAGKVGHWYLISEAECRRYERKKRKRGNPLLGKKRRKN